MKQNRSYEFPTRTHLYHDAAIYIRPKFCEPCCLLQYSAMQTIRSVAAIRPLQAIVGDFTSRNMRQGGLDSDFDFPVHTRFGHSSLRETALVGADDGKCLSIPKPALHSVIFSKQS